MMGLASMFSVALLFGGAPTQEAVPVSASVVERGQPAGVCDVAVDNQNRVKKVVTLSGFGGSKQQGCERAKAKGGGNYTCNHGWRKTDESYYNCQCEKGNRFWHCNVQYRFICVKKR